MCTVLHWVGCSFLVFCQPETVFTSAMQPCTYTLARCHFGVGSETGRAHTVQLASYNPSKYLFSIMTAALVQAHMARLPAPISDYVTDTKSVLDQSLRILQAMTDVSADAGWLDTALVTMMLVQSLMQVSSTLTSPPPPPEHHLSANPPLLLPFTPPLHCNCLCLCLCLDLLQGSIACYLVMFRQRQHHEQAGKFLL